jgi:hypothetical protein
MRDNSVKLTNKNNASEVLTLRPGQAVLQHNGETFVFDTPQAATQWQELQALRTERDKNASTGQETSGNGTSDSSCYDSNETRHCPVCHTPEGEICCEIALSKLTDKFSRLMTVTFCE